MRWHVKHQGCQVKKAVGELQSCQQEYHEGNTSVVLVCLHIRPMGYLSIKYNSTHSDSTSFHSFQNSSVCFYPLYLLLGFASEKEYQLRIQGARVWSYLLVQFTARSGYHSLNSVTSLPVTLEVPQAGAKYDK